MKNIFILILLLLSGFGLSIQGSINGTLGKTVGPIQAAFVSFLVGSFSLLLVLLFIGKGNLWEVIHVPKWQLLGGVIGAIYITVLTIAVPRVGIGIAIVSVIIGQITMSMVIDHFGWFQSTQVMFNQQRLWGIAFLILGLIFIYRSS
ncbi:transporter family-2 protein [Seinonella peptonophila]|uniref:Transporter family-2 protein n=1 Tax=Seinonella peptonophila TaxID=112248 RepID=A0A1M4U3A1_9BACL|nr:DMT family transporter [Seinonella peptonophila]SHE51163.1 transporter family-2 protein [Seinonella peptonophila]